MKAQPKKPFIGGYLGLKAHAPDSNLMLLARDLANCGGHTRDGDAYLAFCLR